MLLPTLRGLTVALTLLVLPLAGARAQTPAHSVYLIGNTATTPLSETRLAALRHTLRQQTGPFTLVHLGDVTGPKGLTSETDGALTARLDALLSLVADLPQGRLVIVPGDKDWANSGHDGLKAVRRLEAYCKGKNVDVVAPGKGCPGPEIIDLAPTVRLVAINTAWFTHPWDRPEEPDTDCKTLSKEEFGQQLDDALSERGRRNVLMVGHHPAVSDGIYGGRIPLKRHLFPIEQAAIPLPVFGTVYAAFRQNVGTPRDRAYPGYQELSKTILGAMRDNPGAIYAAAHDYSLQLHPVEGGFQVVSGSLTEHAFVGHDRRALYNQNLEGFTRLDYFTDGTVRAAFLTFDRDDSPQATQAYATTLYRAPCASAPADAPAALPNGAFPCESASEAGEPKIANPPKPSDATTTVVPGPEYKGSVSKNLLIGPLYRKDWTTPVQVPTLDLNTTFGGLRPIARGGGRQTTSLKMIGGDSLEYVFRSVDKDLQGALPPELRNTVVANILRDVTATSQPYSALVCSELLDATDILHARPRLYRLPDDPARLGGFRAEFAGLLGTLEDRPQDPEHGQEKGFAGSDDIASSYSLFRQLYKDHDARVDELALAKARAFDMLVADFGKHEDNWRWAGFEEKTAGEGKKTLYKPIPRDRDQSFTRWNGALTWTANREWAVPSIEAFEPKVRGLESLNWPARHLDRLLLTSVTREQWQEAAKYLQTQLTPTVLDRAADRLPQELHATTGKEYKQRLRERLADLPRAAADYYLMLAKFVDVVGSNKAEILRAERLASGDVRVQIFDKAKDGDQPDGAAYFDRTFKRGETKEIRLYALDGKDIIQVTGSADHSILLRVVGGDGQDQVIDDSKVSGLRRYTKVYDDRETDLKGGPETNDNRSNSGKVNLYDRRGFEYDGYTPLFNILYNQNDGVGLGAGFSFDKQGWRKPGFKSQYGIYAQYTTGGNRQVSAFVRYRHVFGEWDFAGLAEYGDYYPFYNFFGLGNDTKKDEGLYNDKFYRARFSGPRAEAALERMLLRSKSRFRATALYEDFQSNVPGGSVLSGEPTNPIPTPVRAVSTADQRLVGGRAELDLDFRDRSFFARRGVRFFARHTTYQQLRVGDGGTREMFHVSEGFAEYYGTARIGVPVTLVVKGGGAKVYGAPNERIPFYKFPQLGQVQNLRGYVRNRFTGDAVAYLNTELRFALGQVQSTVIPFSYGVVGFYDMGKAYVDNRAPGGMKAGYGGGFYISPFIDRFALSVLYGQSDEETGLIQFAAGFRIDQ
jgi:hypothetical protein